MKKVLIILGLIVLGMIIKSSLVMEKQQKDQIASLHAQELSICWEKAIENGGTCRIEYLRDRTNTIYGAEVILED